MLELGQPLHAYDAALLRGVIRPRLAKSGEKVTLLDEKEVELNDDTLIITDDSGPIGIAGIMGGLSTAVSGSTTDVFFGFHGGQGTEVWHAYGCLPAI